MRNKTGVDISCYDNNIDYEELIRNINFAIIRVGYGVSYMPDKQKDTLLDRHYNQLYGKTSVGAYYYAYANDYGEGKSEAVNCIKYLDGRRLDLPIYYDIEDPSILNVGRQKLTDIIKEFCETIESNGYKAGVYASKSVFDNKLYKDQLGQYSLWVASYGNNNGQVPQGNEDLYKGQYSIWQYSSVVQTPGLNRKGDADIMYDDVPTPTPTPVPPSPQPTPGYNPVILDYQQSWNKTYGGKYVSPKGNTYIKEDGYDGPETEWSRTKVYLKRGMTNHLVGWSQCRLRYHKGYDIGTSGVNNDGVDDNFGPKTEQATYQFQIDNDLYPDKIIGHDTIWLLT